MGVLFGAAQPSLADVPIRVDLRAVVPGGYAWLEEIEERDRDFVREDVVRQLRPDQGIRLFKCNDIVTHLLHISVPDEIGSKTHTLEASIVFDAGSPGLDEAGYSEVTDVSIYGDTGEHIMYDQGSRIIAFDSIMTDSLYQPGASLSANFQIDDLEGGENLVVAIDARLSCNADSLPVGMLAARLASAVVISTHPDQELQLGTEIVPFYLSGIAAPE